MKKEKFNNESSIESLEKLTKKVIFDTDKEESY